MTKKRSTKRALALSFISLLLCVSMFVGTTFAWFTDSVSSVNNKIVAGNLDVELEYAKVENGKLSDWATVQDADKIFDPNALWEPGRVEVVYLKVSNLGTLALKYQLGVNVYGEIIGKTEDGKDIKLSEHLVFKAVEMPDALTTYTDRDAVALAAGTEKGLKDYNGKTTELEVGGTDYVALIVYMPETVGNEANYRGNDVPTITLGINLFATQVEAESDSFGSDYDEDAWHEKFQVYSADDLQAALNNGEDVVLMNDVAGEAIEVNGKVEIDLNGKTLSATILAPNAELTVKNGKIAATNPDASAIEINSGKLTIDNVEIESARHALRVDGNVEVVINNGTFTVNPTTVKTLHALNVSGNANVTVNGGTFVGPKGTNADSGAAVNVQAGATVTINGGNFSGGKNNTLAANGTLVVKGGTFDQNPSTWVATGYKAVASNGKYVVVPDSVDAVVSTPAELTAELEKAAAAGAGDTTIYLAGDIDMDGTTWTPIKVDGYNGAGIVTVEGNGATITGLTAPLFAGGFAGKSGIVIKNLTIADSDIVSTSGLGGGAFIDSSDSMHVITLENCHLVNSKVKGERTGGLIGWCSGYAKLDDGPVKAYVTISNCSVVDSTVHGAGSAGAIAGHPGASDYTYTTIENCVVKNVKVISDEPVSSWRTGAIVGTANNGHVVINNVTVENVTLTQDGVTATETKLYGRFVPSGTGTLVIDGFEAVTNATQLVEAIKKGGKIIFANDITVDKWIMFSETLTLKDKIITLDEINVTIDGNRHTLTVKAIESGSNGNQLFHAASNLNISNLTIKYADGLNAGGIGLKSGVISNVNFVGGGVAIHPGNGNITVENCTFATNATAIYFEEERDDLTVTGCTFNQPAGTNVILLRGDVTFTNNIINSGRTVNIVSGSPVVTGNNFNNVRLKVYSVATATVSGNTINNLEFETTTYSSNFDDNTLSDAAQAALNAVTKN